MSRRDHIRVNGFSNRYRRWRHEDSDMMHRINTVLKTLSRLPQSVSTYLENKHPSTIDLQQGFASQCTDADVHGNEVIIESQRRQWLEWRGRQVRVVDGASRIGSPLVLGFNVDLRPRMTKTTDYRQETDSETKANVVRCIHTRAVPK